MRRQHLNPTMFNTGNFYNFQYEAQAPIPTWYPNDFSSPSVNWMPDVYQGPALQHYQSASNPPTHLQQPFRESHNNLEPRSFYEHRRPRSMGYGRYPDRRRANNSRNEQNEPTSSREPLRNNGRSSFPFSGFSNRKAEPRTSYNSENSSSRNMGSGSFHVREQLSNLPPVDARHSENSEGASASGAGRSSEMNDRSNRNKTNWYNSSRRGSRQNFRMRGRQKRSNDRLYSPSSRHLKVETCESVEDEVHSRKKSSDEQGKETENLNIKSKQLYDSRLQKSKYKKSHETEKANQTESLIEGLTKGTYECMVCCDCVQPAQAVWSCQNCFHVFHLGCIKKWARSSVASVLEEGWRCPACQNVSSKAPNQYLCFCGKMKEPERNHYDIPHSCGEWCGKPRSFEGCKHNCNILCHPGPCPPCTAYANKSCSCEKISKVTRCGQPTSVSCDNACDKLLNCGIHKCTVVCHAGDCSSCQVLVTQECYCKRTTREVYCSEENNKLAGFSCPNICACMLSCDNHECGEICHSGECKPCALLPELVLTCACGQTPITDLDSKIAIRKSCKDPVPTCKKQCRKVFNCGSKDKPHTCQLPCHSGNCPPCPLTTLLRCQCKSQEVKIKCVEINSSDSVLCNKKCSKKRSCGVHKCQNVCCTDKEHRCMLICNKRLSCGLHVCLDLCHLGSCKKCLNTSFDELFCYCGATVAYPPIACGTKPPECNKICTREHSCDHPVTHNCHSNSSCPPCTFLTEKSCYGNHEIRKNIPCFQNYVSCGMPCDKTLDCGHRCKLVCHQGPCKEDTADCNQPCQKPRIQCAHPCNSKCHIDDCPSTICKTMVNVKCKCGHRSETVSCKEYLNLKKQVNVATIASKLHDMHLGQTVDIPDESNAALRSPRIDCNHECALIDRNRRLALALQIQNPDLTNKLGPPNYSEFLVDKTKSSLSFVTSVYEKLTELVQMAKQSKQKSRSFSFPSMNRDHRRIIHELAEFFGCETISYDEEPNKNVVATAFREKSWLPSVSIMTVVEKQNGQKRSIKVPPVRTSSSSDNMLLKSSVTTLIKNDQIQNKPEEKASDNPNIDYFDFEE